MNSGSSQLEQEQTKRLQEIGAYLRHLREESRLSLEQVNARTMIQLRQLEAIETGRLSQLPEPVYIRALIKRYADVVGADGEVLAAAFPTSLQGGMQNHRMISFSSPAQLRPIHLYVAYILLISVAVGGLSYLLRSTAPRMPAPSLSEQIPPAKPTSPTGSSEAASPLPAIPQKPVRIAVSLTAQSWMRIVVDGKTDFEGIMQEGTQKTWAADKNITVRAGNAGGVMLAFNNNQPKPMGEPGTVEELTFSVPSSTAQGNQQAMALPQEQTPSTVR